jgi:Flp pilus assembly pilin Flp
MAILPWRLFRDDKGQDLIEYTLLLAFVALSSAALFVGAGGSVHEVWSHGKTRLETANKSAAGRPLSE